MNRVRYSVYAVEKGGKFLKSDFRSFTPDPLAAIHFAVYSRTAERAAKMAAKWSGSPSNIRAPTVTSAT